MKITRDNFKPQVKKNLERRVGARCSAVDCRKPTCGPTLNPNKANNVGVAAHITAAAPGGPRYDPSLTATQRAGIDNGIWLCASCATKIDGDPDRYTVDTLYAWKNAAENYATAEFDKPPLSREDYSAMKGLALGRLKKNGISDAMSRIGRLTASQMEELDPRFNIDIAYNAGVTSYTYNPKEPVKLGLRVDPTFSEEFATKFSALTKHGKDLEIDAKAIRFDGSPLFEFGEGKLVMSTVARKSATLKLSLVRKGKRRTVSIDDVQGELVGGEESVTFNGKAFGGVMEFDLSCITQVGGKTSCTMSLSLNLQLWQGKSVRTIPYFEKAFAFYDSLCNGDELLGQVEIEGLSAIEVSGSFGVKRESDPHYRLFRYTRNVRALLELVATDVDFDAEFDLTRDDLKFVEEAYQILLVQPKVGGRDLTAPSMTMSILPSATRHDLANMCSEPKAVRIEHQYAAPLNLFGLRFVLPRIQLIYTKATFKRLGAKGPIEPGKSYRFKIWPQKDSQFFAALVPPTP